jgi:aconitate decarboxylase
MARHGFAAADVAAVAAHVPPLVNRLVGRPDLPAPESNYAKLCLRFVAGCFLARGRVDVPDFRGDAALQDPEVHRFAGLVDVIQDDNPDLNALDPQRIEVRLTDGSVHAITLPHVYGHPDVPLSADENAAKFLRCAGYGRLPLPAGRAEALIAAADDLAALDDATALVRLTLAGGGS